jgi:gliding motility-associated-like protein
MEIYSWSKISCKLGVISTDLKAILFGIALLMLPYLLFSQGKDTAKYSPFRTLPTKEIAARQNSNGTFKFCDTDSDGFVPIPLESIKNTILSENINQFGSEEGIYIGTSQGNVFLVTNLSSTPQVVLAFPDVFHSGILDIAINQDGAVFVAVENKVYDMNTLTHYFIKNTYDFGISTNQMINSLSFDRSNNIYLGGFNSAVYRLDSGNYSQMNLWHDFGVGQAAGDFVMFNDKMYIAWNVDGGCKLYEVTVDANTHYVSHIDLGYIHSSTFGLASELGYLYGIRSGELYKIDVNTMSFQTILTNTKYESWYGAAGKNEAVSIKVAVFENSQDAQNDTNPLPSTWTNTVSGGQIVYVKITNTLNGQTLTVPVDLIVGVTPTYTVPQQITVCKNINNAYLFKLSDTAPGIVGLQPNIAVTYHSNQNDAIANRNPLPDVLSLSGDQQIFVRETNSRSGCFTYFDFWIRTIDSPIFRQPDNLVVCYDSNLAIDRQVDLEKHIAPVFEGQSSQNTRVTFYHSFSDATSASQPIPSLYVVPTNEDIVFARFENKISGCFYVTSFSIRFLAESNTYSFNYAVTMSSSNPTANTIQIYVTGSSEYAYSLDGVHYQNEPTFENLPTADYQIYVRDKNNCGVLMKETFILMFPKFFSPNGDGFNEFWNLKFLDNEPQIRVYIYDRYGKLLKSMSPIEAGWDGTFNGSPLPAADYWFRVVRANGKEYKGHFSLER